MTRAAPRTHTGSIPVVPSPLDRARGDSRVIVGFGLLETPTRAALTEDLLRFARLSVGNRLGIVRGRDGAPWSYDPGVLVDAVADWSAEFPGTEGLDLPEKLAVLRASRPTPDHLRIYLHGHQLITDLPHAVFDGVMVVQLWLYLTSWQPDSMPPWVLSPDRRPTPMASLLRHLARSPGSVPALAAAGSRRSAAAEPTGTAPSGEPVWRTCTGAMSPAALAELQAWRAVHAASCSTAVLLMTSVTRAMSRVGVELAPHAHVVVDGRRYDPRTRGYLGNLAVGLNLEFPAPHRPHDLQRELSAATASGRPLAAMLAISLGERMSRRRSAPEPALATVSGNTVLSFSHLLGLDTMPDGHWIGGFDAHEFAAITEPADPGGVAFLMPKMRDRYDLSATFDARFHDPETIRAALTLVATDSVRLLTGAGSEASGPHVTGAGSEASGPKNHGAGSEASGPHESAGGER